MQRRVSLVVLEQNPNRSSLSSEELSTQNISNISNISNNNDDNDDNDNNDNDTNNDNNNISSSNMKHTLSMLCQNPIEICSNCHSKPSFNCYVHNHKIESNSKDSFDNNIKKSLDDLDLHSSSSDEKGSIPMIGSLIYFKSKNDNINDNNNKQVPLPHKKINSTGNENLISDNSIKLYNDDEITSDSENSVSSISSPLKKHNDIHKAYRHFSYPCLPSYNNNNNNDNNSNNNNDNNSNNNNYNNNDDDDDEFSNLNSKIHSRIKQNNERLNHFLQKEKIKDQFNNIHFHIPGLDPDPTSFSSSGSSSGSNTPNSNNSHTIDNLNTTNKNYITSTNASNNRHRRRLTCAMIFTRPKVVEI